MDLGTTSLAELRAAIRQRADQPITNGLVTEAELDSYIRASAAELYDVLVQKFGAEYFSAEYPFTTDGTSDRYALPADFYKLLGVDISMSPGVSNSWVRVAPFTKQDRNQYNQQAMSAAWGRVVMKYRLWANKLWLIPRATAGQSMQILYIPRPPYLSDSGTVTCRSVVAGNVITVNGTLLTAAAPLCYPGTVTPGAGNTGTMAMTYGAAHPAVTVAIEIISGIDNVRLTVDGTVIGAFRSSSPTELGGVYSGLAGVTVSFSSPTLGDTWTFALSVLSTPPAGSFWVLGTNTLTGAQLATAIGTIAGLTANVWSPGTVTITQTDPGAVTITLPSSTFYVPRSSWTSLLDGYNGWEEYVLVDCVIKMKVKEETDPSLELDQKKGLLVRIEAAAENRDGGAPQHVSDCMSSDWWPR